MGKFIGGGFTAAVRPALLGRHALVKTFDTDDIRQAPLDKQLAYAAAGNRIPILAQEGLSEGFMFRKKRQAKSFKQHFGQCKAILFIREPVSFLKSFYVQMLRNFNQNSRDQHPRWMLPLGRPPRYFDINQWMTWAWYGGHVPQGYLRYADTALTYAREFGPENVRIFLFEQFVKQPEVFIEDLCDFIGIDAEESMALIREKKSNARLTQDYIDNIKKTAETPELKKAFRNATWEERQKLLIPGNFDGQRINPELSKKWLDKIDRLGRVQNRRIVKHWNLPVEDFGYKT